MVMGLQQPSKPIDSPEHVMAKLFKPLPQGKARAARANVAGLLGNTWMVSNYFKGGRGVFGSTLVAN